MWRFSGYRERRKDKFEAIKNDPIVASKYVKYGFRVVLTSVLMVIASLLSLLFKPAQKIGGPASFFGSVAAIIGVMLAAVIFLDTLINLTYQFRLNRKMVSWLSFLMFLFSTVATGAIILFAFFGGSN